MILFLMTGSVLLPVKSLVMNPLGLAAAFGLLVLVFQDGRLEGLLGYESQGALESTQPLFIIRALLVPALMKLLGEWNWWAPGPLRRLYERAGLGEAGSARA